MEIAGHNIDDVRDIKIHLVEPHEHYSELEGKPVAELLAKFELRNYRGPVSAIVVEPQLRTSIGETWMIHIHMAVMDVATGEPTMVYAGRRFLADQVDDSERANYFGRFLHEVIRSSVLHELDECLMFDGRHLNDPHPERVNT